MDSLFERIYQRRILPLVERRRAAHCRRLRERLELSESPTIISSDCFGSFIYHDLGLQFCSPTINLFIGRGGFIRFVKDLPGYLGAELEPLEDDSVSYPVGILRSNGGQVRVDFMHYKTFADAKAAWDKRKQRVDYSRIYIIQLIADGVTEAEVRDFESIPYENKMLIADANPTGSRYVVTHRMFREKDYYPGKILVYRSRFSARRFMEDIDYVDFLNRGQKK